MIVRRISNLEVDKFLTAIPIGPRLDHCLRFLQRHGIQVQSQTQLHFGKHKECFAFENGDSYTLTIFTPFNGCGMKVDHGNDDYVYSNEVVFTGKDRKISVFQFRCIYEDKYIVSSGPLKPSKRTLQFTTETGAFDVSMELFRASTYSFMDKHNSKPTIKLNEPVYVSIDYATTFGWSDLTTTIKTCYATDAPEHTSMARYHPLIFGMCVSPEDDSVEILENGGGPSARFKFNMFKWRGVIAYIYLHCEVHLCNSTVETCYGDNPMCHNPRNTRRKRRDIMGSARYRIPGSINDLLSDTLDNGNTSPNLAAGPDYLPLASLVDEEEDLNDDYANDFSPLSLDFGDGYEDVPEEGLQDFITQGPILIDDQENVGMGTIEATLTAITYDDDFLRIYIFSTIAVLICLIAFVMACLLALKRRRSTLQKINTVNEVYEGDGQPDFGLASANIDPSDIGKSVPAGKVLPAITGLPLPPTPSSTSEGSISSENSKSKLVHLASTASRAKVSNSNSSRGVRPSRSNTKRSSTYHSNSKTSASSSPSHSSSNASRR